MEHKNEAMTSTKVNKVELCDDLVKINLDEIWSSIKNSAIETAAKEHCLRQMLEDVVISRDSLADSLAVRLARRLARPDMERSELELLLTGLFRGNNKLIRMVASDMEAIVDRDPACQSALEPLLFYKGFLAISAYRVAHHLWLEDRKALAYYFQSVVSEVFAVDIHPAATIGCGILLDHATSFVVGETSIIENDVSILHEVTLGGTGKVTGDRHPIIKSGVLIGAGAKILGRVTIGECAKVGAGSVVLKSVPAHTTVAGVPAEEICKNAENPALDMNQQLFESLTEANAI